MSVFPGTTGARESYRYRTDFDMALSRQQNVVALDVSVQTPHRVDIVQRFHALAAREGWASAKEFSVGVRQTRASECVDGAPREQ